MSSYVLLDVTSYVGKFNFTTKMNSLGLSASAEELDSTTFGNSGYRTRKAGLKDVEAELAGYWDSEVDDAAFSNFGVPDDAVTMSPSGVEGDPAYLWRGEKFSYSSFGQIGALTPFTVTMMGSHNQGVTKGTILKKQGSVSATGATGTAFEISGGVQTLYSHFHVFSAGTTITAIVESADNEDFDDATTRVTHSALTAVGSNVQKLAGPITDTWYRVRISAITGTFSVACAIGVGV